VHVGDVDDANRRNPGCGAVSAQRRPTALEEKESQTLAPSLSVAELDSILFVNSDVPQCGCPGVNANHRV